MRKCAAMPYHTGIRLRIYPSREQKQLIAINSGAQRFVYNRLVALNTERYRILHCNALPPVLAEERLSYLNSILDNPEKALPACLQNSAPFLNEKSVDSMVIANGIKNYNAAWKQFRKVVAAGIPSFHKKGYEQSYQTNAHYKDGAVCINDGNVYFFDKNHIRLPLLGRIRFAGSQKRIAELMGREETRVGTITIRKDNLDRYFASLLIASEHPFNSLLPLTDSVVGIDLNIENFLWDSNGNVVDNPKYRRELDVKLKAAQRTLSRRAERAKKEKRPLRTSRNYQKARMKVAKLHAKIAGRSNDFRHRVSKMYVKNHDFIVVEDLKVKNLLKNHNLAKAISECGWSDFTRKLEYKAAMYGKQFMKVAPAYTTQTCSCCGYVLTGKDKLTLGDREWVCPSCKAYHVRDYNAATNILNKGLIACVT